VTPAEEWIDLLLKRSAELRRAGILSIGCDGNSAVLAPAEPDAGDADEPSAPEADEPVNPWENPASYPTGHVPSLDVDDADDLPPIPEFDP
jgi:hypothetical protein